MVIRVIIVMLFIGVFLVDCKTFKELPLVSRKIATILPQSFGKMLLPGLSFGPVNKSVVNLKMSLPEMVLALQKNQNNRKDGNKAT